MGKPQRMARWGYWAIWICVGLYFAALDGASAPIYREHLPRVLVVDLSQHLFWGLMVLGMLKLLKRYPLGSLNEWRPWAFYLGLSFAMTFLGLLFVWGLIALLGGPLVPVPGGTFWDRFWSYHWRYFHAAWVNFILAIGAWYAYDIYRRYREREVEASRLEAELAKARHQALRMQLQPHFLFNTLNTINSLIRVDPSAAERMVAGLGDLLRATLEQSGPQEVPLRTELEVLESYLEIQRVRFGPRLQISVLCPEELADAMVPNLILQPLVENAFKHGLGQHRKEGRLEIRASRQREQLVVEVEDNGKGLTGTPEPGIGISNTLRRLALLYGPDQTFDLAPGAAGGTLARLRLPIHWTPLEEATGEWFDVPKSVPILPDPRTAS